MSLALLLYCAAVAALLVGAAALAEGALAALRLPRRLPWVLALVGSLALPLVTPLRPAPAAEFETLGPIAGATVATTTSGDELNLFPAVATRIEAELRVARPWIAPLVGTSALVGLVTLLGSAMALRRRRVRWPLASVRGREVRLTRDFGPALVGLVRPWIALPRPTLELADERLELVLRHEEEHRRARDPWLLWFGALTAVVLMWNPFVWLQLRRLRRAIEFDCDARVLDSGVSPARYGRLLFTLQTDARSLPIPVPMFGDRGHLLEWRLMMIKRRFDTRRPLRAGVLALAAGGVVVAACDTPTPVAVDPGTDAPVAEAVVSPEITERLGLSPGEEAGLHLDNSFVPTKVDDLVVEGVVRPLDNAFTKRVPFTIHDMKEGGDARDPEVRVGEGKVVEFVLQSRIEDPGRPLVVIDGEIADQGLEALSSTEIESIEVTKGDAAREMYGTRGENGVVRITTKQAPRKQD